MPGYLLHEGALVVCPHAGQATPLTTNPRVKVAGQAIVTQTTTYTIASCGLAGTSSPPCATATWMTAATRVKAGGVPVLLGDSHGVCAPTLDDLEIILTQQRVRGI